MLKRGREILLCIHSYEVPEGFGRSPSCKDRLVKNAVGKAYDGATITAKLWR
jgi:hypothetical protein